MRKAKRFKRKSPEYRKAIEDAYDSLTSDEKKVVLRNARGREGRIVRELHSGRDRRAAQMTGGDRPFTDRERRRVARNKRSEPFEQAREAAREAGEEYLFRTPTRGDIARDDERAERNRERLGESVKSELEGRGKLANVLDTIAEQFTRKRGKDGASAARVLAAGVIPGSQFAPPSVKELGERAAKDAINLPAQAIPSVYVPTAGAIEAAKGDPERLKQYLKDIDETDPLWNVAAAAYEKVTGDSAAASERLRRAGKSASEHPGYAAAELVGAKGAIGRGAGNVARTGVVGKKAKRAASTDRTVQSLEGTKVVRRRAYSPDVITKAAQVAMEKRGRRKARKLREQAKIEQNTDDRLRLQRKAARVDPDVVSDAEIRRRVDENRDAVEAVRRHNRAHTVNEARRKVVKRAEKYGPLVALVAQKIVRPEKGDIEDYLTELEEAYPTLDRAGKAANKQLVRDIENALDSPKLNLAEVKALARDFAELSRPLDEALVRHEMLAGEQADMAKLMPYAIRRMGARHDGERLISPDGDPIGPVQIRDAMREAGDLDFEPVFISHGPRNRSANFFISQDRPPSIGTQRRTGEATRGGTFGADAEVLAEQVARAQGLVDAHAGFARFLDELGIRDRDGDLRTFTSRADAVKAARNATLDAEGDPLHNPRALVPVRANPWQGRQAQLEHLLDDVNGDAEGIVTHQAMTEALDEALAGKGPDDGPWILVPEVAVTRQRQHISASSPTEWTRAARQLSGTFRDVVLSTSLSWFMANVFEGALRLAVAGAGPRSFITGRRVVNQLGKEGDQEALARLVGGGHMESVERQRVKANVSHYDGTSLEPLARRLAAFFRAPGPKQLADVWHGYTRLVFHELSGRLESNFQTALLGRELRKSPLMDEHLVKLSERAIDQAVIGLRDTNVQVEFGRAVDRAYGKYSKMSPSARRAIALYSPFAAWSLNALNFIYRVLPQDHPVVTALTAQAVTVTQEWRETEGLDKFLAGRLPDFLQGSIPGDDGEHFRASRFTPFGVMTDLPGTLSNLALPQVSGPLGALAGQDWTGTTLRDSSGEEVDDFGRYEAAAKAVANSFLPFLSTGQQVARKGPEGYAIDAVTGRTRPKRKARKKSGLTWSDDTSGGIKWSDEASSSVKWSDE